MFSLLSEIHFWTTQEDVVTKHCFYGAYKYYSKKEILDQSGKKIYSEQRGVIWNPVNRRNNKLKERLKEFEEYLIQNKIIHYLWKDNTLQLLLSTGLIVYLKIKEENGDLISISFDKHLAIKLQVNIVCDGLILGPQVICICNDGHVLGYGGSWKEGWLLEGGPRRRVHSHNEWLVVWGRPGSEHPQPWSPLTKDHQRANVHLYWLGLRGPELLAYKNTDGEPFIVLVSQIFDQTLILVEQKVTQRGAVSIEVSNLELSGNSLKTIAITAVPLQTQVSCCDLSSNESYLLICCIDSTLAILDRNRGSTRTIKASFIPTLCTWQKLSALAAICNDKGQIQYYDVALNCVKCQIMGEDDSPTTILDLTGYFHSQVSVVSLNWDNEKLLVALEQGPIVCVTHVTKSLSFVSLAKKYIGMCEIKKAIALLLSWQIGENAFFILKKIVSCLLKKPMTEEVAQQLQDALGFYHASPVPLSAEIRSQYGSQIFSATRRYFHQLVRAGMYETAFLLAVDVVHHDLFMDLHYIAVKIGETEMAAAARAQASALVSRCSSEASNNCSQSECSDCSSTCENKDKEKAITQGESAVRTTTAPPQDKMEECTNFNQPESPKTYIVPSGAYEFPKLFPPRVNYVKPPQVPANFNKHSVTVPPLPFNFSTPNLFNNNLGIPVAAAEAKSDYQIGQYPTKVQGNPKNYNNYSLSDVSSSKKEITVYETKFCSNMMPSFGINSNFNQNQGGYVGKYSPLQNRSSFASTQNKGFNASSLIGTTTLVGKSNHNRYFSTDNIKLSKDVPLNFNPQIKPRLVEISGDKLDSATANVPFLYAQNKTVIPPPLPFTHPPNYNPVHQNYGNRSSTQYNFQSSKVNVAAPPPPASFSNVSSKKPQSKVKFSDTVTAFIVPEVKRPVRPAPLPHLTDPQKELADSLPLCHPNEDYLKDFAPVRANDEEREENKEPPKIKVVHFGVV